MPHLQLSSIVSAPYTWPLCIFTFIHLFLKAQWWLKDLHLASQTHIQQHIYRDQETAVLQQK